jgi:hypothetical protein
MFSIYSCMRFIFVLPSLGTRPTNRFETEQATNTDEAQLCIRHNTVKTDNIYSSNYMQDTTHINIPVYKWSISWIPRCLPMDYFTSIPQFMSERNSSSSSDPWRLFHKLSIVIATIKAKWKAQQRTTIVLLLWAFRLKIESMIMTVKGNSRYVYAS